MIFAYFQPCITDTTAKELDKTTKLIAKKLDIELCEAPFSCCGRSITEDANLKDTVLFNIRNCAVAEGKPLLTTSSNCYNALKKAQALYNADPVLAKKIDQQLAAINLKYKKETQVKHLLEVLFEQRKEIESHATSKVINLKVAPYYGVYFNKPNTYMQQKEQMFEKVLESCGAKVIEFTKKEAPCGTQTFDLNKKSSLLLMNDIITEAKKQGADVLITLCPFEHILFDMHQQKAGLPILHLSQFVALAMGIDPDEIGLENHFTPTASLFNKIRL